MEQRGFVDLGGFEVCGIVDFPARMDLTDPDSELQQNSI